MIMIVSAPSDHDQIAMAYVYVAYLRTITTTNPITSPFCGKFKVNEFIFLMYDM